MLAAFPIRATTGFLAGFFRITFASCVPHFFVFLMRGDLYFQLATAKVIRTDFEGAYDQATDGPTRLRRSYVLRFSTLTLMQLRIALRWGAEETPETELGRGAPNIDA
jgi:hypothetical protein